MSPVTIIFISCLTVISAVDGLDRSCNVIDSRQQGIRSASNSTYDGQPEQSCAQAEKSQKKRKAKKKTSHSKKAGTVVGIIGGIIAALAGIAVALLHAISL